MKLNNHGWGTGEFIFSVVAILVLLLIAVFNAHRLYSSLDTEDSVVNNTSNSSIVKPSEEKGVKSEEYSETETEVAYNEEYYTDYQEKMINATRNYIIYASLIIPEEGLRVELSTLVEKNYIDPLNDMLDGNMCNGYSMININSDSSLNIKTYLSCSNYETEGY